MEFLDSLKKVSTGSRPPALCFTGLLRPTWVCPHVKQLGDFCLGGGLLSFESNGTTSPQEGAQSQGSVSFIVFKAKLCRSVSISPIVFPLLITPRPSSGQRQGQYLQISVKTRQISPGAAYFSCFWLCQRTPSRTDSHRGGFLYGSGMPPPVLVSALRFATRAQRPSLWEYLLWSVIQVVLELIYHGKCNW